MAEELKLKILPQTGTDYNVCLSKFFLMTFFDKKGKHLDVFVATVFGGYGKDTGEYDPTKASSYNNNTKATLNFDFSNNDNISSVDILDITNKFLSQKNLFDKFWGSVKEYPDQDKLDFDLKKIYPNESVSAKGLQVGGNDGIDFYCIEKDEKHELPPYIVTAGNSSKVTENKKWSFTIESEKNGNDVSYNGIQFINWTYCKIELSRNVLRKPVVFTIDIEKIIGTPDFTWYFAPPIDYEVRDSRLRIGGDSNKWERNKLVPVSDSTTVPFEEWKKLLIDDRIKSKVDLEKKKNFNHISVELSIKETSGLAATRQFFYGLIIAFLLSYFADYTRAEKFIKILPISCFNVGWLNSIYQFFRLSLSFCLPVMIGLGALSVLFWPKKIFRSYTEEQNKSKKVILKKILLYLLVIIDLICEICAILVYIFIPVLNKLIMVKCSCIMTISKCFFYPVILSIILNLIYICIIRPLKHPLRDIL